MQKNIRRKKTHNYSQNLFVYGTLQHGQSRNDILKGYQYLKAKLRDHTKIRPPNLGFPFIIKKKGQVVHGEVYFKISAKTLREIDIIEAEGSLYHRILVEVNAEDGVLYPAYTYYPSRKLIDNYT